MTLTNTNYILDEKDMLSHPTFELPSAAVEKDNRVYNIPSVTSTATEKVTEDLVFFRRNLYFENLFIFFKPKEKTIAYQLRNKKTDTINVQLKMTDKKITFYQRKGNVFHQGFVSFNKFEIALRKHFPTVTYDSSHTLYSQLQQELHYYTKLFLDSCNYKHPANVYYKFYNYHSQRESLFGAQYHLTKAKSKVYFYKRLKQCEGLREVCMFLFSKKDKCYRQYVEKLMSRPGLNRLHLAYILIRTFKFKPQDVIEIPHINLDPENLINNAFKENVVKIRNTFTNKQIKKFLQEHYFYGAYYIMLDTITMREALTEEQLQVVKSYKFSIDAEHNLLSAMLNTTKQTIYKLPHYPELDVLHNTVVDGWQIQIPDTSTDLLRWGNENKFCIGSYDYKMINGSSYCLSLVNVTTGERYCAELTNNPYYDGRTLVTLNKLVVTQFSGLRNKQAPQELKELLIKVIQPINVRLIPHEKQIVTDIQTNNVVTFTSKVQQYLQLNNVA